MLLGSLRYIGRGWTFDDIEECTAIHEETHRQFFHVFLHWGSTTLFAAHVRTPSTKEDALRNMQEMAQAGFHGCLGSSDATHVGMEKCTTWLAQAHMGPKLNMPSRTYNMTVNHRRRILSTTFGHPARWNYKTIQLFDEWLKGLYDGAILGDFQFVLLEKTENGEEFAARYQGHWVIVDNRYLR